MECTQRLECTQELYSTHSERLCPEQIGILGICGEKYPIKKGPNKVGRDPQTCNIILNLNSVSRQHAVINILNKKEFMLMDLDSANKTKLLGKTLKPYVPEPLHNGDTVQFGEIFGVFRLLEEEDDLPMTQALNIPDTPAPIKHVSRINAVTTVPESPDVSDKDDSFIVPSQPKGLFQSPKTRNFIKPGRTISIQPIGSNKIDNIYWNSSKKSTSLNLDDSDTSLTESLPAAKEDRASNDIRELKTQMYPAQKVFGASKDSIYTANTQLPDPGDIHTANTQLREFGDVASIHAANTQLPPGAAGSPLIHTMDTQMLCGSSPSIHNMNTQLPPGLVPSTIHNLDTQMPSEKLPEVCKINELEYMRFDLCANKHDGSIFNAEIQLNTKEKENIPVNSRNNNESPRSIKSNKLNSSNDEVLFDDVDEPYEEAPESQGLLTEDIDLPINRLLSPDLQLQSQIVVPRTVKRNMRIDSDSSADCEDIENIQILPKQKNYEKKAVDDDTTDCEEDMIELKIDKTATNKKIDTVDGFEDMPTQVILQDKDNFTPTRVNNDIDFEDMPTQVLDGDIIEKDAIKKNENSVTDVDFEDLPTQVLDEDIPTKKQLSNSKARAALIVEEENSPFKIPCNSALKAKRVSKTPNIKPIAIKTTPNNEENKYYQDTQDIYDDLCTQKIEVISMKKSNTEKDKQINKLDTSVSDLNSKDKVDDFVKNLSNRDVLEMIGVDDQVAPVKKVPSDDSPASDAESTPKKTRTFQIDIDLPDSQEIKTIVSQSARSVVTESSSESETETNSEEQCTPILFHKKNKTKPNVKMDLVKKFDIDALPSRIITRVRKPTERLLEQNKNITEKFLKPKFLTDLESEMNKDIITENISRLKSENEKVKNIKVSQSTNESKRSETIEMNIVEQAKKGRGCRKKTEEVAAAKPEIKPEKSEDLSNPNDSKKNDRKKREPRNTKKENQESENQPSTSNTSTNQSFPIVESKDKTHITKKSKEVSQTNSIKTPVEIKKTRNTRNAKTKTEDKAATPNIENQTEKPKRKYNTRKPTKTENKEVATKESPEKEIRRSKRRPAKEEVKKESIPKSILKKASTLPLTDESAVYNMSSSSNSENSRSFKRPILDDSDAPSTKRTRSGVNNHGYSRATPDRPVKTQYVLFTAFPYEEVKHKLENMGTIVVTDVMQSTVLLTKEIKRTFKLLCAVGLGKPIVGPSWVQACVDSNTIVDPWLYLIKDEMAENRFHFSLERTLTGMRNFLKGYNVSSTPKVMPQPHEMKLIVECSGGTWKEGGRHWICVSVPGDSALWPSLRAKGATIVSTEFILGGVLRQRVDINANMFK